MQNTKQREKIEFWIHKNKKIELIQLAKSGGYTLAELIRKIVDKYLEK